MSDTILATKTHPIKHPFEVSKNIVTIYSICKGDCAQATGKMIYIDPLIKATIKADPKCPVLRGECHDRDYDYLITQNFYDNVEISRWAKDKSRKAFQRATVFEKSEFLWEDYKIYNQRNTTFVV